jgi:hypothetical protein
MANLFDDVPETEPSEIIAGDLVSWKRTDLGVDYPPASYDLKYSAILEGQTTPEADITATADGTDFVISLDGATTGAYTAGRYHWTAFIERQSDNERITIDSGFWDVESKSADPRTHAVKMLAAIEALLENRSTADVSSYAINGRSLTKMSPDELMTWRSRYKAEVVRQNRKARGLSANSRTLVDFS